MDENTIQAAKRGIEIGVLRGDLNLVKTCFDLLWGKSPVSATRNWLRFNTPALIIRNCFYLLGEYLELYKGLAEKRVVAGSIEEERIYRAMYYKLAVAVKNKDVHAIFWTGKAAKERPEERYVLDMEITKFWDWLYYAQMVNIEDAAEEVFLLLTHQKWPPGFLNRAQDSYLLQIVTYLKNAIQTVDLVDNKQLYLASMVVWGRRHAFREEILESWNSRIDAFLKAPGIDKPSVIPLPWYVYDPMTDIGREAVQLLADKTWTPNQIKQLWLLGESYRIKKTDLLLVNREIIVPSAVASVWWIPCLRQILETTVGPDAKKLLLTWKNELAPKAQETVEKLLKTNIVKSIRKQKRKK